MLFAWLLKIDVACSTVKPSYSDRPLKIMRNAAQISSVDRFESPFAKHRVFGLRTTFFVDLETLMVGSVQNVAQIGSVELTEKMIAIVKK